jgi:hypothetical protein
LQVPVPFAQEPHGPHAVLQHVLFAQLPEVH